MGNPLQRDDMRLSLLRLKANVASGPPPLRNRANPYPVVPIVPPPNADDSRWFSEHVQPHEGALRNYLRSLTRPDDVDDVIQDSYLKLWRSRASAAVRSPKSFLFAIARNVALDLRRRRQVAPAQSVTETEHLPVLNDDPGVVDLVSRQQELALLRDAIQSLPERCRQVFLLRKIQGLSQREIAERLGISENTVETLVGKGARRCAEYLRAHTSVPPKA